MADLIIMRHAKSSWADPGLDDHERPLRKRGRRDAALIGGWLQGQGIEPRKILSSTALRARQTMNICLAEMGQGTGPGPGDGQDDEKPEIIFEPGLFHASPATIKNIVAREGGDASPLMVVGHNPGLNLLALDLSAEGSPHDLERLATNLPTAALAIISLPLARWQEIGEAQGRLTHFITPKMLRPQG